MQSKTLKLQLWSGQCLVFCLVWISVEVVDVWWKGESAEVCVG